MAHDRLTLLPVYTTHLLIAKKIPAQAAMPVRYLFCIIVFLFFCIYVYAMRFENAQLALIPEQAGQRCVLPVVRFLKSYD